jgi:hypothetical protein
VRKLRLNLKLGPKTDEVTGEWRKLHNEELHNLYSFPDIIRQMNEVNEVGRAYGTHGRGEKRVQDSVGKPEGKRPLGRRRRRWEDGIRMARRVWIRYDWLRIWTGGVLL